MLYNNTRKHTPPVNKKKITNNFTSQILSSEKVVKRETLKEEGYNKQHKLHSICSDGDLKNLEVRINS